jgi:O-antigen biosynthesis protein WbqP
MPADPVLSHSPLTRAIDCIACLVALPVAAPLCVLLLILIRLETPGSPLFVQERVGRHEKSFQMLKLRTMVIETGDMPSHDVDRAGITRLGRILRKLKLDELPQLLNVLAGSMSLVGPRPCLPSQTELIHERQQRGLFALRPGVTGPAQLIGVDMSEPRRLAAVEAEYFGRANTLTNIGLILRTIFGGGRGDAAAR